MKRAGSPASPEKCLAVKRCRASPADPLRASPVEGKLAERPVPATEQRERLIPATEQPGLPDGGFELCCTPPDQITRAPSEPVTPLTPGALLEEVPLTGDEHELEVLPEIRQNLLKAEEDPRRGVAKGFLDRHPELSAHKRMVVVDWLHEVHTLFHLRSESFFLAVRTLDRFLSRTPNAVAVADIQMLATACLLIATKFEDVEPAEAKHLGAMAQGNHEKILRWEREVLRVLEYSVGVPTVLPFLRRFRLTRAARARLPPGHDLLAQSDGESAVEELTQYFATRSLLVPELQAYKPSQVAKLAGSFCPLRDPATRGERAGTIEGLVDRYFLADLTLNTMQRARGGGTCDRRWPREAQIRVRTMAARSASAEGESEGRVAEPAA